MKCLIKGIKDIDLQRLIYRIIVIKEIWVYYGKCNEFVLQYLMSEWAKPDLEMASYMILEAHVTDTDWGN